MIVYKIESDTEQEVNSAIKDMELVLAEIAPTLRILQDLLKKHADTISTPSIDRFRTDILNKLPEAIHMAHLISTNSQILAGVSTQANKQLIGVETQARASLLGNNSNGQNTVQPVKRVEGVTNPGSTIEGRSAKLFQRQTHIV